MAMRKPPRQMHPDRREPVPPCQESRHIGRDGRADRVTLRLDRDVHQELRCNLAPTRMPLRVRLKDKEMLLPASWTVQLRHDVTNGLISDIPDDTDPVRVREETLNIGREQRHIQHLIEQPRHPEFGETRTAPVAGEGYWR